MKICVVVARVVNGPTTCVPDTATEPDQLPDAVHDVAFTDVHESVVVPPDEMVDGVRPNDVIDAAVGTTALVAGIETIFEYTYDAPPSIEA